MSVDYEFWKFLMGIGNVLGTLAVGAYTFIATRDKDNSQHIKAVEEALTKAISEHAHRLSSMEMQMRFMPTPQQLSELQGDMQSVQTAQEAIQREISATRKSVDRIEDFLLKK